jgi:hypothetical protein
MQNTEHGYEPIKMPLNVSDIPDIHPRPMLNGPMVVCSGITVIKHHLT